ncbi:hypothetical protein VQ643_01710 [Pseudomonas sp. F1_0610]|uniref:hypothetical protein n=1 Tax=Pseudomonas sp. F1_0610 TaxID=3114284 RepID=UPI0039C40578
MVSKQLGNSMLMVICFILIMGMLSATAWRMVILETKVIGYSSDTEHLKHMATKAMLFIENEISNLVVSADACVPLNENGCNFIIDNGSYFIEAERLRNLKQINIYNQTYSLKGYWKEITPGEYPVEYSNLKFYEVTAGAENNYGEKIYMRSIFSRYYF